MILAVLGLFRFARGCVKWAFLLCICAWFAHRYPEEFKELIGFVQRTLTEFIEQK